MTRAQLEGYLNVGGSRSVCVALDAAADFPGYIRTVTLRRGNAATVEFLPSGHDEGGPAFHASYPSLDEAIAAIEAFLERPLAEWTNAASQPYPDVVSGTPNEESHQRLRDAIARRSIRLPEGNFAIQDDGYWSRLTQQ